MSGQMEFPETFEKFAKEYGFKDDKEVYTNGSDLISIFRVKQWLEHDNKLRKIETDTAYECGKHANKWISVSERLPQKTGLYLVSIGDLVTALSFDGHNFRTQAMVRFIPDAWMPLPEPYNPTDSEKE